MRPASHCLVSSSGPAPSADASARMASDLALQADVQGTWQRGLGSSDVGARAVGKTRLSEDCGVAAGPSSLRNCGSLMDRVP